MKLKFAAAIVLASSWVAGAAYAAADFVTIPLETVIDRPADQAWKKVSDYCGIGAWFKTTCTYESGTGKVGTVRVIAGRIEELLVARTAWSYTYSQPKSPIDYHGTVEIQPIDKGHSKLLYTLVYDAGALPTATPEAKAADKERRTKQFTVLVATMKGVAEAK